MRHFTVCALALAALASSAGAQDQQALIKLIDGSFATAGPARVYDFLNIARMQGLIRNSEEAAVAKELYQAYSDPAGEAAGHARTIVRAVAQNAGGTSPLGGNDLECNDTVGFAEVLNLSSGSCTVLGSTGTGDLRDVYQFSLATESEVTISATATATPTTVNLFDNVGRLVVVGLTPATGRREIRKICLPAGTFYVNVVGTSYTLTVTQVAATCPTLALGANPDTVNPAGLATDVFDVRSWKFTVPAATHADVQLTVASTATLPTDHNLFFNLGRATAGRVHFCDNVLPLPAHANDPVMKAGLPGGTYYVYVQNSIATVVTPIAYTLTMGQTTITPRALCGATNYTFSNSGDRDLFCVRLPATDHISVQTALGTAPPTGADSYIELFDADMGLIVHNDDGSPTGAGGLFSWLDMTLPAGTYYLTFRGFSGAGSAGEFGDYLVTGTCGLPVTLNPIGARRAEPFTIAVGSHAAFTFTACNDHPLSVTHTNNCHLIGANGKLRGSYQQLVSPGSTTVVGTSLRDGEVLYINNRTTSGIASTTATLYPAGQLGIDLTPVSAVGAYQLKAEDKIGNTYYLFLSVGSGPGYSPGPPFTGKLCLDLITLTPLVYHSFTAATSCRQNFALAPYLFPDLRPFIPPASVPGLRFQAVVLPGLTFTNMAQ